jgi:hypothetical protein
MASCRQNRPIGVRRMFVYMTENMTRFLPRLVIYSILSSVVLTYFLVLTPIFNGDDLDSSWKAALLEARYLELGFGNEVNFTLGPLSHIYSRSFTSSLFYEQIFSAVFFSIFYLLFFINAAARSNSPSAALVGIAPFALKFSPDAVFIGLPLCTSLLGTLGTERYSSRAVVAVGAAASALATLAKFSVFPVALIGFLIADLLSLKNKRFPITFIIYTATMIAVFYLTSPKGSLFEFILTSLDVASGYAEAMSISGPIIEVGLIFAGATVIIGLIALSEFKTVNARRSDLSSALGRVAIAGVFLLVCIKGGLVRHDAHAVISWFSLALLTAFYCAFSWHALSSMMTATFAALTVVSLLISCASAIVHSGQTTGSIVSFLVAERVREYRNWAEFLSTPYQWMSTREVKYKAAVERIRAEHVWPALNGTLDIIPSKQSALIANKLRYQPRPSIQQYISTTPSLVEKNRAFFHSDRAPDFLLMAPEALDKRHPATAEGPIWPDLLALYAPLDMLEGMALLRKRDRPLDLPVREVAKQDGIVDKLVSLAPMLPGATFARIDIQPTFLGRLASTFFKSALLYLDVRYTNGVEARYRFLPAIARQGFFLSPLIDSGESFFSLSVGLVGTNRYKVESFVVRPGSFAKWLWKKTFTVSLGVLEDSALRSDVQLAKLGSAGKQRLELLTIMNRYPTAELDFRTEVLLAPAPNQLAVGIQAERVLEVGFGILDQAWQGNANTDGVCFRVTAEGSSTLIWERCLDPKKVTADRGPQTAQIRLPELRAGVVIETSCWENCDWDWSYWSRVSLR